NSAYSNTASATTAASQVVTPPAAPSNLIAVIVSATKINLTWVDNSTNETGFVIQRQVVGTAKWTTIAQVGANVTNYSDITVNSRKSYQYRVYATNSA